MSFIYILNLYLHQQACLFTVLFVISVFLHVLRGTTTKIYIHIFTSPRSSKNDF